MQKKYHLSPVCLVYSHKESIEDIVNEMEKDSNYNDFHTNRSPNFSIIEMAKGTSRINDMNDTKSEDDINMNLKKNCKCKC